MLSSGGMSVWGRVDQHEKASVVRVWCGGEVVALRGERVCVSAWRGDAVGGPAARKRPSVSVVLARRIWHMSG